MTTEECVMLFICRPPFLAESVAGKKEFFDPWTSIPLVEHQES